MGTEEAIEIFRDHLNMKDGTEFIWQDWEDAALHILTIALDSKLVRKERDTLRNKHTELIRVIELAEEALKSCYFRDLDEMDYDVDLVDSALSEIRKLKGE